MKFYLPELKYSYNSLEPFIDTLTMETHHSKHHQTYITKLNDALDKHPGVNVNSITELIQNLDELPEDIKIAVRNNGGGHLNHSLYWTVMAPPKDISGIVPAKLLEKIKLTFETLENFKSLFSTEALNKFGSGWAWLVVDKNNNLKITSTSNQDSPLSSGYTPILALDVWEHAYYLKYQNRRAEYITNWWNVVKWEQVTELYDMAISGIINYDF